MTKAEAQKLAKNMIGHSKKMGLPLKKKKK